MKEKIDGIRGSIAALEKWALRIGERVGACNGTLRE